MTIASGKGRPLRPVVKICGLTRAQDVQMCARHGADILGFVVEYPRPVPWNLSTQQASALVKSVLKPAQTCVVTGGQPDKILRIAREIMPCYVQLHHNETPEDTQRVSGVLSKLGIRVIKALSPDIPGLEHAAKAFAATGVWALLLDSRTPENPASGGAADFSAYQKVRDAVSCPVILAGGITPQNVREVLAQTSAPTIDLMTGVECSHSPGLKDEAKVRELFQALR